MRFSEASFCRILMAGLIIANLAWPERAWINYLGALSCFVALVWYELP
jgi:hypothetical protein